MQVFVTKPEFLSQGPKTISVAVPPSLKNIAVQSDAPLENSPTHTVCGLVTKRAYDSLSIRVDSVDSVLISSQGFIFFTAFFG